MNFNENIQQRYSEVDLLSTQGRIGRRTYFVFSIIVPFVCFSVLASIAGTIAKYAGTSFGGLANTLAYILLALATITVFSIIVRLTIQRCHDFNANGWLAAFALIPFANIIFALIPGNGGLNSYGEAPEPPTVFVKIGVVVLALLLTGLVAYAFYNLVSFSALTEYAMSIYTSIMS